MVQAQMLHVRTTVTTPTTRNVQKSQKIAQQTFQFLCAECSPKSGMVGMLTRPPTYKISFNGTDLSILLLNSTGTRNVENVKTIYEFTCNMDLSLALPILVGSN